MGFETRHLLLADLDLQLAGYSDARAREFYRRLDERLSAEPGVVAVSCAIAPPVDAGFSGQRREIALGARVPAPGDAPIKVDYNGVAPRYFKTLGVGLARGREFTAADAVHAPLVAVVNEAMARRFWPGADPVGQTLRIRQFFGWSGPVEVVGVARDTRTVSLESDGRAHPEVFLPLEQDFRRHATVLVRAADAARVAAVLRDSVRDLDPALPLVKIETAAERMAGRLTDQRLYAELTGLFGLLALVLAGLGLYGTLAFDVSQRRRELAVRMALGAPSRTVMWMVVRHGLAIAVSGATIGLVGSLAVTRVLASSLYGVTPTDPLTFVTAAVVLLSAALLASWLPARRSVQVEPSLVLRQE